MLNKKFLCIALIVLGTNFSYANVKEDIAFLNELYRQEKYHMAEQESKRFLMNYPESKYNKNICERLAKLYYMNGNYTESQNYFLTYLQDYKLKKKEKQETYSYLYKINMVLGNYTVTDEFSSHFIKNKELYERTLYDSGVALLNNGNNVEAIKEFKKVKDMGGAYTVPSIINLAMGLYNNSQYGDAIKYLDLYSKIESQNKDFPLLNYLYGASYYKLNDLNKAISYFEYGVQNYPNNSYSQKGKVSLIEIYVNRHEIPKALTLYSDIKNKHDKRIGARVLGDYFLSRDEYRRALEYYDVIGENKIDSERYTYGYTCYKLGMYEKAIKEFEKIKDKKYILDARYYTVLTLYNMKEYNKVVEYKDYMDNYKNDSKRYIDLEVALANSYYELKDNKKAYSYYKEIYNEMPTLDNLYRTIILGVDVNDRENIDMSFEKYKEEFPQDTKYRKNIYFALGNYYYKNGRTEEGINIYKEYLKTNKDIDIGNNLVTILVNEKRYNEVLNYLNILEENDDNAYLKGIAYMGIGKYEDADKIFTSLKEKEELPKEFREKVIYNMIKNEFLWEKYSEVIERGNAYLKSSYLYGLTEIVDRIGLSYYRLGKYDEAREVFKKLLVIDESKGYANFQIAETYFAQKNYDEAKKQYKLSYLEKSGKKYEEEAKYWELNCDLNMGEYDLYMKKSDEYIKEFPKTSYRENISAIRGEIFTQSGSLDEAIKEYEDLYENSKDNMVKDGVIEKIIAIYNGKSQNDKKIAWIDKFSDKYKKSYYKSMAYRENGMKEEARKEEKILFESPNYKDYAIINLAEDNYYNKNYTEAKKGYKEIREMDSSLYKDMAIFRLGEMSYQNQKYEDAILDFSKIIVLYPESDYVIPAKLKISDAYYQSKQIDKAEKGYIELLNEKRARQYKEYIVERLLFISLEKDDKDTATKYYNQLKKINIEAANKYQEFFVEQSN